jgi:hypothetical protein
MKTLNHFSPRTASGADATLRLTTVNKLVLRSVELVFTGRAYVTSSGPSFEYNEGHFGSVILVI